MTPASKIALITGSSSGLGFEVARKLDALNYTLLLTGRSEERLNAARNQLQGKNHYTFAVDLIDQKALGELLKQLCDSKLIPDVIVHSLGRKVDDDVFPLKSRILKESMRINIDTAIEINERFLPYMQEKGMGRIIHVGSDASLTGKAAPAYVVAKAAINGYVKASAQHYAKSNIMLCAVLPGIFEHEGSAWHLKKINQPDYYQQRLLQMPLGRFGKPEEIAEFIAGLAVSDNMMSAGELFMLRGAAG